MDNKLEYLENVLQHTDIIDPPEVTYIRMLIVITNLYLEDIKYSIDEDSFLIYTNKLKNIKKIFDHKYNLEK